MRVESYQLGKKIFHIVQDDTGEQVSVVALVLDTDYTFRDRGAF